jgi:ketosteroid isomerase-like protein
LTWKKNKTEIQALEKAYAAAELAKDAAGVAAYYAEDAVSICIETGFFMYIFFY